MAATSQRQRSAAPLPLPSAAELLALIADGGDIIARAPDGRAFLLLDLDAATFDGLCAFGSDREDLEDEPDDDSQDEPAGAGIHPLDRNPTRPRR